jgi:uncharacterized repeat protein (TIGR01451 family)
MESSEMKKDNDNSNNGQALVEFALIIGVLLLLIFVMIESARLFQAWQTVQNAAREAGRYAITGQFDPDCLTGEPPCSDPRVYAIRQKARQSASGLVINDGAGPGEPNFFYATVRGVQDGQWCDNCAGDPGERVVVNVTYRLPIIIPGLQSAIPSVRLMGQVEMHNENYIQRSSAPINNAPPEGSTPPSEDPYADLAVEKTAVPNSVVFVGEPIVYRLAVTNEQGYPAGGITVVDILPAGLTVNAVNSPTYVDCTTAGEVVTCTVQEGVEIWPSVGFDIYIHAAAPDTPGTITNTVTVSSLIHDPYQYNNVDHHLLTVVDENSAQLEISGLTAFPSPVTVDDPLTYHVTIYNHGNVTATGLEIISYLPPAVTFASASPGCTEAGGVVTCALADLPVEASDSISIDVVAPSSPQDLTMTAEVTANEPNPGNDYIKSVTTVVVPRHADLTVTINDNPDPVPVEQTLTYLVTAINNGPSTATGVDVTINLDNTLDPNAINVSQGSCNPPAGLVLVCTVDEIASGATSAIVINVVPTQEGTIVAGAQITGIEHDPNPNNNATQQTTTVTPSADLAITKAASHTSIPVGQTLLYTLQVTNNGPSDATGVTVVDNLPVTASFVSATTTQGACSQANGVVTCLLGDMAAGSGPVTIEIAVVPVEPDTTLVNTANVTAEEFDPETGNNSATVSTQVLFSNQAFITNTPNCGEPGDTVAVNGYNWRTQGNHNIILRWLPAGGGSTTLHTFQNNTPNWTVQVTIPANAPDGTHRIQAERQNDRQVAEAVFTIPCPAPDLTIGDLELVSPLPLTTYEPVVFRAVITNIGTLPAVSQFFVGLYANPDPDPTPDMTHIPADYRLAVVGINGLAVGESTVVTLTALNGLTSTGPHKIYAVVDSDPGPTGIINERFETNNIVGPLEIVVENEGTPPDDPIPPGDETGYLIGTAYIEDSGGQQLPQAMVLVRATHLASGAFYEFYTTSEGVYGFGDLPVGTYTVTGCFIEGNTEYFASESGVMISEDVITEQDLVLDQMPCS